MSLADWEQSLLGNALPFCMKRLTDNKEFKKYFDAVMEKHPDFKTDYASIKAVSENLVNYHSQIFVAYDKTGIRGFMVYYPTGDHFDTLFTMPCTEEQKIPGLLSKMVRHPFVNRHAIEFTIKEGYNDRMIPHFVDITKRNRNMPFTFKFNV